MNILTEHAVAQALRPLLLLRFQISSHESTPNSDHHGAPGLKFLLEYSNRRPMSMLRIADTLLISSYYSRSLLGSAAQKYAYGT